MSGIGWIRGADWGGWDGDLAGATLKNSSLWIFEFSNKGRLRDTDRPSELRTTLGRLRTAVMGPDGALYVPSQSNGDVYRVAPEAGRRPGDQDINGDGYDDLVVGAPGDGVRTKNEAGQFNVLYGSANGLVPNAMGEVRDQRNIKGANPQSGDHLGAAVAYGDIDGDGMTDLVVSAPDEDKAGLADVGSIHVICGRTNGVEGRSSQSFTEAGTVAGEREAGDRFGESVAIGDFDGDGHSDVASGIPGEDVSGVSDAGAVTVLYGTSSGITTEGSTQWSSAGDVAGSSAPPTTSARSGCRRLRQRRERRLGRRGARR